MVFLPVMMSTEATLPEWQGAITTIALNLGDADAVEKILAREVAFSGKARGLKLSKTALSCRFDNPSGSY
ncbi:hypothetical protein HK44_017295 [Pseudomonas fluorescens HK44]|uniref:Uncharacterized protein n=1 Tax=Pseudomonas fluorescens HK44 TaxID=1042209 RepID=A0A010T1P4_PSEFL|nr:hypothetical protein HK44_017295 [Pseudomonas fluorescens HK44]